jgi:hypothetical protein
VLRRELERFLAAVLVDRGATGVDAGASRAEP